MRRVSLGRRLIFPNAPIFAVIAAALAALTLPVTALFLNLVYGEAERLIEESSERFSKRVADGVVASFDGLISPVRGAVRAGAALAAAQPDFFKAEVSSDYLHELLVTNEGILSAYIAFADGSLRQVARVTPDAMFFDYETPPGATLANRVMEPLQPGRPREDRVTFFSTWGFRTLERRELSLFDPRGQTFYRTAMERRAPSVTNPVFSPSARGMVVNVTTPVRADGQIIGVFAANISLKTLAEFAVKNVVSPKSRTILLDGADGVIAHPELGKSPLDEIAKTGPIRVDSLRDAQLERARTLRNRVAGDRVTLYDDKTKQEYAAFFLTFPSQFEQNWEVITITPIEDFLGDLRRNRADRQWLAGLGAACLVLIAGAVALFWSALRPSLTGNRR